MEASNVRNPTFSSARSEDKQRILNLSPFGVLDKLHREAIVAISRVERLLKRHILTEEGAPNECVVLIGSGRVKLERASDGGVFPLGHRGPGETVGETSLSTGVAQERATVVDDTEALMVSVEQFRKLIVAEPVMQAAMGAVLAATRRATEERLESLLLRGVEARLVGFLLSAERRWGRSHAEGTVVAAPFTHAEIALLIGSTRETVTLLLGKLRRMNLISFDKRRVVIRDRDALGQYGVPS